MEDTENTTQTLYCGGNDVYNAGYENSSPVKELNEDETE
jgi:hypothetical protein